jgi:hypothetical protein
MRKWFHSGNALTAAVVFAGILNLVSTVLQLVAHDWLRAGVQSLLLLVVVSSYWVAHWFRVYGQQLYDNAVLAHSHGAALLQALEQANMHVVLQSDIHDPSKKAH